MFYRIGLDIGVGSVGWSVLENDPVTEEPVSILKLGVRTFAPNEIAKTGESTAAGRREKRGIRRRRRRQLLRIEDSKKLFKEKLKVDYEKEVVPLLKNDVYELRTKALDKKVSLPELERIFLNILKHRGFKSNRKNVNNSKEGKLLEAIKNNDNFIKENGYRTIGEAIFKDGRFYEVRLNHKNEKVKVYNVRNHGEDYKNCFQRSNLEDELKMIFEKQKEYHSQLTTNLIKELLEIFARQRNFDEGPGEQSPYKADYEIGNCTFVENEKRAAKSSYTFEYFTALSKINNLKINDEKLTDEQVGQLIEFLKDKKEVTFAQVRKLLNIEEEKLFNLCNYRVNKNKKDFGAQTKEDIIKESEKVKFVDFVNSYSINKALDNGNTSYENQNLIDEIALMLSTCKSDDKIDKYIQENDLLKTLSSEQVEKIKELNCDKFGSLSIKAMQKIIPFLEKGQRYDIACKSAGFNHSSFEQEKHKYLKGDFVDEALKDVTSNVVKRAVNQTLRIVNEIIKHYGSPQYITIELSRELAKRFDERRKIEKIQKENALKNESIVEKLKTEFKLANLKGQDIVKYKLYEEQDGKCMYSGKTIDVARLFEPNYLQIDHILPYSRSFDDSYNNKVLVIADENQNKGNKTPFEYFGADSQRWQDFVARANLIPNIKKRNYLLKIKFGEEQQKEFIERNLNDTKYMSKLLLNLFQKHLQMTPSKKYAKKNINSINGAMTSYLRKVWTIDKIREDGDIHHSIDATLVAVSTLEQVQKITKFNQFKEIFKRKEDGNYINVMTGEIMTGQEKEEYENKELDVLRKTLPYPYDDFFKELKLRSRVKYENFGFNKQEKEELVSLGYDTESVDRVKPVFISRMKAVKETGAIHEETMMSGREYNETKRLIKSTAIQNLKLVQKSEAVELKDDKYPNCSIENYYRPQDDRLLYLKLKEHLVQNGKIDKNVVFYKPKSDGSDGPVVKKVKTYEKGSNVVVTPNGYAANDKMYRVDVYKKEGKYYLCPVYMADVYAHKYPNKVIVRDKDWETIDNTFEFMFSLYKNDLIKIKNKKPIALSRNFKNSKSEKSEHIESNEFLVYYNSTNISTASIEVVSHDNCYSREGLGVKTLQSIEKYYVDIMGNIYKAPKESFKEI